MNYFGYRDGFGTTVCIFMIYSLITKTLREKLKLFCALIDIRGTRCSSLVRTFAHGAMNRRLDPSWWSH